jgi:prevent-host-death family protein
MALQRPEVQTVKASDARQQFSQLINEVYRRKTRVLIEKSGIPVAAIISAEDLARFERMEEERRERFRALEESWAAFADVPLDEIEEEVDRAVKKVREERRVANR